MLPLSQILLMQMTVKSNAEPHSRMRQVMRLATVSVVGLPLLSRAGVKRARLRMMRQVALSRAVEPLDPVTLQAETRPSGPTVSGSGWCPARRATGPRPDSRRPRRRKRGWRGREPARRSAAAAAAAPAAPAGPAERSW